MAQENPQAIVNQIEHVYGDSGGAKNVLLATKQAHDVAVGTLTPAVGYGWEDGASGGQAKYVRLASMTYPDNQRTVYYSYGPNEVGAHLSRLRATSQTPGALENQGLVQYRYMGSGTVVKVEHPDLAGGLTLAYRGPDQQGHRTFPGFDRFGRAVQQNWTNAGATTTVDSFAYGYDANSNVMYRDVQTPGNPNTLDEAYDYDGLDRLSSMGRGQWDEGQLQQSVFEQGWGLDGVGNWSFFDDDGQDQDRTHNAANELTGIANGWASPVHDAGGNMIEMPKPGDETAPVHLTYDAWNRLTEVRADNEGEPGDLVASYEYDGLNRRIQKTTDNGQRTTHFFYNEQWQVIEERSTNNQQQATIAQYVWDARYIDSPVVRFHDSNADGDLSDPADNTLYYTTDANWNVTGLVNTSGQVVERYAYTPYGQVTVLEGQVDRDGNPTVDWSGDADNASDVGNSVLYGGYRFDVETGLYQVRNRYYHPTLGRFANRDPIVYAGGANLYGYYGLDPMGTGPTTMPVTPRPRIRPRDEWVPIFGQYYDVDEAGHCRKVVGFETNSIAEWERRIRGMGRWNEAEFGRLRDKAEASIAATGSVTAHHAVNEVDWEATWEFARVQVELARRQLKAELEGSGKPLQVWEYPLAALATVLGASTAKDGGTPLQAMVSFAAAYALQKAAAHMLESDPSPVRRNPAQLMQKMDNQLDATFSERQLYESVSAPPAAPARIFYVNPAGEALSSTVLARQGTSHLAGNFQGLKGATLEEIVARVPSGWTWAPQRGGNGLRFFDASRIERLRLHGPSSNPQIPASSNSRMGWTMRVMDRAGNYYDDLGRIVPYNANEGHIPIAGNPNAR
jgi:RHS repeat-associated protein